MSTQEPASAASVNSVAEAAERAHLALRRAVVDVAVSLVRAGVLSHSGHADLSARIGPDAILVATVLIGTTLSEVNAEASRVVATQDIDLSCELPIR